MRTTLLVITACLIGGCTARYTEPTLGPDHPASPAAAESPPRARSHTLDLAQTESIAPAAAEPTADHAGHVAHEPPEPSLPGVAAPTPQPADNAVLYVCPMHPDVTSDKRDQRCPKCGMKLVKKKGDAP